MKIQRDYIMNLFLIKKEGKDLKYFRNTSAGKIYLINTGFFLLLLLFFLEKKTF